jgi:anti-anti-sigma factor
LVVAVRVDIHHAVAVVRPSGDLDLATWGDLEALLEIASSSAAPVVVVDLAEVTFIDASGLAILERAGDRLREQNRQLILRNPSEQVIRLLEISGLAQVLPVAVKTG